MITERLYLFLKAWQSGSVYDRTTIGLCTNARMWDRRHLTKDDLDSALWDDLGYNFSDTCTPFGDDYALRSHDKTMHLCPRRVAWVKSKVEEYERNLSN